MKRLRSFSIWAGFLVVGILSAATGSHFFFVVKTIDCTQGNAPCPNHLREQLNQHEGRSLFFFDHRQVITTSVPATLLSVKKELPDRLIVTFEAEPTPTDALFTQATSLTPEQRVLIHQTDLVLTEHSWPIQTVATQNDVVIITFASQQRALLRLSDLAIDLKKLELVIVHLDLKSVDVTIREIDLRYRLPVLRTNFSVVS